MTKHTANGFMLLPSLDPNGELPLYRQLYDALRQTILSGQLAAGTQLPATRILAHELGISRTTVMTAFDQLLAEGYVYGKVGSGTYVAADLPDELLHLPGKMERTPQVLSRNRRLSQRGHVLATASVSPTRYWKEGSRVQPLRYGQPALDRFPFDTWVKLLARRRKHMSSDLLGYTHPAGYPPLRREIAAYVRSARGVQCDEEQVIIVSGSQQGIDLATWLLIDPGDAVWIEDPCYLGARGALRGAAAHLVPVPVDTEGLDVASGIARCSDARLAYVTPSHQFPMGVTMSLSRRLALLRWANRAGAWILEDDYDSEYRYTGRSLSSLQGLDTTGRVIYIGTMSKVLFPGLRLGYLIVPPDLVDAFIAARSIADRQPQILDQLVLTDFIAQDHFAHHIRRMRALYEERQAVLVEAASHELKGLLTISPSEAGMHLVGTLPTGINDVEATQQAALQGVSVTPLSAYCIEYPSQNALQLGYTAFDEQEIREAVHRLAIALHPLASCP